MKKLSLFNRIIFIINAGFAIALLVACFLPNFSPKNYGFITILSLIVPLLIIVNVLFVIYWVIIGFKRQLLQSVIVLILSYFFLPQLYKFMPKNDIKDDKSISLLTYNVRKFNKYKWIEQDSVSFKIQEFIKKENPDIVVLQEFEKNASFKLNYPYSYNHYSFNYFQKKYIQSGLVTYSNYPIIAKGSSGTGKFTSNFIYTDILVNQDTVRILNFHLASLGVDPNKEFLGQQDSERLLKRFKNSFQIQEIQIDSITQHISMPANTILAGDMNNNAYSWAYKKLKSNFVDSFEAKGEGFGKTYSFKTFPIRIDYIFAGQNFTVLGHNNYDIQLSDHSPVLARVVLN